MTFTFEVTRPDDLLRLRIEARNLKRDGPDGEPSVPVVDDLAQPAYLIVVFPPQAIGESAYFEATVVTGVSADVPPGQIEPPLPTTIDPLTAGRGGRTHGPPEPASVPGAGAGEHSAHDRRSA